MLKYEKLKEKQIMKIFGFVLILLGIFFGLYVPIMGGVFIIPGIFLLLFGKSGVQKELEKQNKILEKKNSESDEPFIIKEEIIEKQEKKVIFDDEEKEIKIAKRMQEIINEDKLSITEAKLKAEMEYILEKQKENQREQEEKEEKEEKIIFKEKGYSFRGYELGQRIIVNREKYTIIGFNENSQNNYFLIVDKEDGWFLREGLLVTHALIGEQNSKCDFINEKDVKKNNFQSTNNK